MNNEMIIESLSFEYNVVNNSDKLSKLIYKYIIQQSLEKKTNRERDYPNGSLVAEPLADEIRISGTNLREY
jgi:hypothetical protein